MSPAPDLPAPEAAAAGRVVDHITRWRRDASGVLVVAIDGHGGSGKTTIARAVAKATGAALIHTDDFFRDERATLPADAPPLADYYDWSALRRLALEPLRAGREAAFRRRHWEEPEAIGRRIVVAPRPIVVVEGVTACAPAIADLVDRRVLVVTPEAERLRRLHGRVSDEDWDEDWLAAERVYFGSAPSFHLVVSGGTTAAADRDR